MSTEAAVTIGMLLGFAIVFGVVAWVAMDFIEADLERFRSWLDEEGLPC